MAGAGDVNGDGYADIVVGAYGASTTTNDPANYNGRTYLYLGNLGNLGAARPGGSLRLYNTYLTTRSVQGRVRARLVWEVAANGGELSAHLAHHQLSRVLRARPVDQPAPGRHRA